MKEGLFEIFLDAHAVISTPTCGPCLGGYMGILAKGERAVTTTNRNFVGRMGHPESEVYLANPAVAAASAVLGRIGSPGRVGGNPHLEGIIEMQSILIIPKPCSGAFMNCHDDLSVFNALVRIYDL